MKSHINVRNIVVALVALGLLLLPLYSTLSGNTFILTLFTRFVIYALAAATTAAPALSSMLIYLLMAIVLVVRPEGLFPAAKR